jgi:hypothetical protein
LDFLALGVPAIHRARPALLNLTEDRGRAVDCPGARSQAWNEARAELARRLQLAGMHAPKRAFDICEPWAEIYLNLMPIHEKLRGRDFQTIRNYLKVTLCNIHDEFTKRLDGAAVAPALREAKAWFIDARP